MARVEFNCLATMHGSLPHLDAAEACQQTLRYLKDIPAWPQLPRRTFLENMYVQYSQGFPGVVINRENEKIQVDRRAGLEQGLERLYGAYLENDYAKYAISADYAAGLHQFLNYDQLNPRAVKGHVTGPVSWGMTVSDNEGKAVAYDETLADAAAKMLKLKASWMESELKKLSSNTIIMVDEPYLTSLGSAFFALDKAKVVVQLEEVFSGIKGLKGIHCCGNTDWSVLLGTSLDILSFDTYSFAESLPLYPREVKAFLQRGGAIAWGIVPNDDERVSSETSASLLDRLEEALAPFTRKGIDIPVRQLISQGLLTPCCGLGSTTSPQGAVRALELLSDLSLKVRSRWS
jgi:methionine synthase II (cobalamin-independent)